MYLWDFGGNVVLIWVEGGAFSEYSVFFGKSDFFGSLDLFVLGNLIDELGKVEIELLQLSNLTVLTKVQ